MRLIQCASSSLTPTHQRYAVCELECMAVQWAIKKSDFYRRGLPHFEIWTDHKTLVGVFSKGLNDSDNPRLMRFREKIMFYNFTEKWVLGKTHRRTITRTRFLSSRARRRPKGHRRSNTLLKNLKQPLAKHHNRGSRRQSLPTSCCRATTNRQTRFSSRELTSTQIRRRPKLHIYLRTRERHAPSHERQSKNRDT